MDMTGHDPRSPCGEDVAPYALGALSVADARRFEEHLAGCDLCRADLATLRPVVEALPATAEQVPPPPELRQRLMTVVEREAAERRAERAPERQPSRSRFAAWLPRPLPALAAACVLLVAGVGLGIALTGGEDVRRIPASDAPPGVSARLELHDDSGRLLVEGMDPLPAGRVMQVWLVRGQQGKPEPTDALFTPSRRGDASVAVGEDLDKVSRVLVSVEPVGGSRSPTTAPSLDFRVQST